MSLIDSSATELMQLLQSGEVSAVESTQAFLDQIQQYDSQVRSFLSVAGDSALESTLR